jgi:hypothetical protein
MGRRSAQIADGRAVPGAALRTALAATVLLLCLAAGQEGEAEEREPVRQVVFLTLGEDDPGARSTARSLDAHLASRGIRVSCRTVAASPGTIATRVELARRLLVEEPIHSVIWMERDPGRLFVAVGSPVGAPRLVERRLPDGPGSESGCGDFVAAIVRSVLDSHEESVPAAGDNPPSVVLQWGDPELPPFATEVVSDPDGTGARAIRLAARTGYGLLLAQGSRTINHAPVVAVGVEFEGLPGAELTALFPRATTGVPLSENVRPTLVRLPLRLDLRWRLPEVGALGIAPGIGMVLDLLEVQQVRERIVADDFDEVHAGAAVAVLGDVRPLDWLSIWLELGADWYFGRWSYAVGGEGEEVLGYGPFQGRVTVGLTLLAPLR